MEFESTELSLSEEDYQKELAIIFDAQWISVAHELPPLRRMVLVNGLNPNKTYNHIVTMGMLIMLDKDKQFWLIMIPKDDTVHMVKGNVSHWQHMPKGPKAN